MSLRQTLQLFTATAFLCAAANATTVFNFDNDSIGTSTTFTDTVGTLSATFSSSADPGGFIVFPTMFDTLTGNVLGDPGPAGANDLGLVVNFNQNLSTIGLNFATADFNTPSLFTLTAYENGNQVGTNTSSGQFLSGFVFPEGEIAFSGANFNEVALTTIAPDFAVDNIAVNTVSTTGTATPEPSTLALLGAGLLALSISRVRRRSNQ